MVEACVEVTCTAHIFLDVRKLRFCSWLHENLLERKNLISVQREMEGFHREL